MLWGQTQSHAEATPDSSKTSFPIIHRKEIEKHKTEGTGIWVTYKDGVYDVTDFVSAHPGGNKILLAAGGPLEPFWSMYAQHKQQQVWPNTHTPALSAPPHLHATPACSSSQQLTSAPLVLPQSPGLASHR